MQFLEDKAYDKQFAGFVRVETIYGNCKQLFLSKNELHKHLKEKYTWKTKAISRKAYPVTRSATKATAAAPLCALTLINAPTMPRVLCDAILIMESIALKSNFRFGYVFCN